MKKSTKTLIYSGVAIIVFFIAMNVYVMSTATERLKGKPKQDVVCNHIFTSSNVDSIAFDFPNYGHNRITVVPGQTDSIIFKSGELADKVTVNQEAGTIRVSTLPDFEDYLLTEITVTLKHIPTSIYTNGVRLLILKDIASDSLDLDIKQDVSFENCRFISTDIRLASNYDSKCIISGTESQLGFTRLTSIEPIYVTDGVSFDLLTLVGNQVKEGKNAYPNRKEVLRGGPLILFESKIPPIKIEESEYPFGVYLDGPLEIK
ncbi:MAG: hypothetical protein K2N08_04890 [Muribaculaceae bacterium]|nr:hypothetical protein [Muribaculaceae bacterium]